jgi:branched-chain amino acid transport system substrate-binding protein
MTSKKGFVVFLAFILLAGLAGTVSAAKEIKIGVSAPLTGDIAALGESTKNAALLAQEEINSAGGLKVGNDKMNVKFVIEDDENKPESAATVFQKLIFQDQVLAIIGSQSSKCSNAGAPIAESAGVPQISPWSTNPNVTKGKNFVFRACFIDPFQGKVVAQFAKQSLKAKSAAVLYDVASDYNKGIAEVFKAEFTKAGGKIVAFETYTTGDKDFSAQLTKIKSLRPDVLFIPDYYSTVSLISKQVRGQGLNIPMLGADGWDEITNNAGPEVINCYYSNHYSPDANDPAVSAFVKKYQSKFKIIPNALAALG